jgi:hypothetical protein
MLEFRSEHDEHDVKSYDDGAAGDDHRSDDIVCTIGDVRDTSDRPLSDIIYRQLSTMKHNLRMAAIPRPAKKPVTQTLMMSALVTMSRPRN